MMNDEPRIHVPVIHYSKFPIQHSIFPYLCALSVLCGSPELYADETEIPGIIRTAIGVTAKGSPIPAVLSEDDLDLATEKTRLLVVSHDAGLSADVLAAVRWFNTAKEAAPFRNRYTVSAIPAVYPEGAKGREDAWQGYPPRGPAYPSDQDPEAAYLWRWIGMHAPDLVIEVDRAKSFLFAVPPCELRSLKPLRNLEAGTTVFRKGDLCAALVKNKPAGVGFVPAISVGAGIGRESEFLQQTLNLLDESKFTGPSPARKVLQDRLDRTPLKVAQQLAEVYGRDLNSVAYIPTVAAIGQLRLAKLTGDAKRLAMAHGMAAPYASGKKPSQPSRDVAYAGHLIFAELAGVSEGDARKQYIELAKGAADALLRDDGSPDLKRMSSSQMSDAVFMSGPILARVGQITGEARYFDAAAAHAANMAKLDLREDGLWRHSPLDEAAWGRGNGFPALGLAMILDALPDDHAQRDAMRKLFLRHMTALGEHQDDTGAWRQVIDHQESYRELSCTCMITYAMLRGVHKGWLEREKFTPMINRAWHAIRMRVAEDGTLVDVCTGTGKQKNLRAYLDRKAILGRDARGGAMALLVATELAAWEAENARHH